MFSVDPLFIFNSNIRFLSDLYYNLSNSNIRFLSNFFITNYPILAICIVNLRFSSNAGACIFVSIQPKYPIFTICIGYSQLADIATECILFLLCNVPNRNISFLICYALLLIKMFCFNSRRS